MAKLDLVTSEQLKKEETNKAMEEFFSAMGLTPWKRFLSFSGPLLTLEEIAVRLATLHPNLGHDEALKEAEAAVMKTYAHSVGDFPSYEFQELIDRHTGQKYYRLQYGS